jgi:hypothetical protein
VSRSEFGEFFFRLRAKILLPSVRAKHEAPNSNEEINTHMLEANRQNGVQQYVTPLAKKPVQIRTDDDKRKRSA